MEQYNKWNKVKIYTQQTKFKLGIKQREIFWAKK